MTDRPGHSPDRAEELRQFNRYPTYKDSAVEWLGEIPAHWELKPFKALLLRNDSGTWGEDAIEGGTIVLRSTEQTVNGEWSIGVPARRLLTARETVQTQLGIGDLVVTKSSGSDLHIGKTSIVDKSVADLRCGFSNFMQRLRVHAQHEARFYWYLMNAPVAREQFVFLASTTTGLGNLNASILGAIRVPALPLAEQRAIAAFLDRETARIDALVAKKERLIELLAEQRTSLITRAVTKGLDPTVPLKDSGVAWLGQIPSHWEAKALSRTLLRITYGFTNPMPVADAGPYMLTAFDIGDGEILYAGARRTTDEAFERLLTDKSRPRTSDLLITKDGTLGRIGVVGSERVCINQSVALLRFNRTVWVAFMQHVLRAAPYQERMAFEAGGTAIKHIYISRLARMAIALPEKEEQCAIADFLDREIARNDSLVAKVRDAIDRLKELRTALISAAVTGKIDVRNASAEASAVQGGPAA